MASLTASVGAAQHLFLCRHNEFQYNSVILNKRLVRIVLKIVPDKVVRQVFCRNSLEFPYEILQHPVITIYMLDAVQADLSSFLLELQ